MDPNATLARIRELTLARSSGNWREDSDMFELIDLIEALDKWISSGGFLPTAWSQDDYPRDPGTPGFR